MTRYIPDLASYSLDSLRELYRDMEIDLAHPDPDAHSYTHGQLSFVKLLIKRKVGAYTKN